ncbi:MAG TPA: nucleotidyltransferase domain-containing protein, partial [Steroidobacteraceae bacterium]|nr:nucleotidyltransferase domain-containing protein [Steroidobacteraceae bacterium]
MVGDPELLEEYLPSTTRTAPWPFLARLPVSLAEAQGAPAAFRDLLKQGHEDLKARFFAEESIETLVHARALLVDAVLREVCRARFSVESPLWALVAVGGYGRGELHPCSDIDLLLLVPAPLDAAGRGRVEKFVAFLWDIGLEVGHSVRTVEECAEESAADVGVMTTMLEARLLSGNEDLVAKMRVALGPDRMWPVKEFFDAKVREQTERHLKANDTAYNLEPNVKTGPG